MSQTKAQLLGPVLGNVNFDDATLFVDSANNRVGIGTQSPATSVEIRRDNSNTIEELLRLTNSNTIGTIGQSIKFQGFYDSAVISSYQTPTFSQGGNLRFQTYSDAGVLNTGIVLDVFDRVGIGTANPTTKLELQSTYTSSATNHFATFARAGGAINAVIGYNAVNIDYMYVGTGTAHPFGLRSNNTLALYIDTAQNVGIGTTNPSSKIHLNHVTKDSTVVQLQNSLTTISGTVYQNYQEIKFLATDSTTAQAGIRHHANVWSDGNSAISFWTSQHAGSYDERVRIIGSGRVGIGTTIPSAILDVRGELKSTGATPLVLSSTDATDQFQLTVSRSAAGAGSYYAINSIEQNVGFRNLVLNQSGGNVGIGTVNPQTTFEVRASNQVFDGFGNINMFTSNAATVDVGGSIALGGVHSTGGISPYVFGKIQGIKEGATNTWNGALRFGTTSSTSEVVERVRITSTGNIGIGTSNPQANVHIANAGELRFSRSTNDRSASIFHNSQGFYIQNNNSGDEIYINTNNISDTVRIRTGGTDRITANSNDVTIPTAPLKSVHQVLWQCANGSDTTPLNNARDACFAAMSDPKLAYKPSSSPRWGLIKFGSSSDAGAPEWTILGHGLETFYVSFDFHNNADNSTRTGYIDYSLDNGVTWSVLSSVTFQANGGARTEGTLSSQISGGAGGLSGLIKIRCRWEGSLSGSDFFGVNRVHFKGYGYGMQFVNCTNNALVAEQRVDGSNYTFPYRIAYLGDISNGSTYTLPAGRWQGELHYNWGNISGRTAKRIFAFAKAPGAAGNGYGSTWATWDSGGDGDLTISFNQSTGVFTWADSGTASSGTAWLLYHLGR